MKIEKKHNSINEKKISTNIEKFGWQIILVESTEYFPAFAYTIGLWQKYNHPEIISFGLTTQTLHIILNDVGEIAKKRGEIIVGKNYNNFFENSDSQFLKVNSLNIPDYFGQAINYYKSTEFPALQLVWTDRNNNFPWDNNYEIELEHRQPLLDRNIDFKYREAKNIGVFTTRQWIELGQPILHVIHDNDGDWQFLTGDQMPEDIELVSLEEMITNDKTLNEVFNLDYGEQASRAYIGGNWSRTEIEDEELE